MESLAPRCPHCGSPTRPHCKETRCGWRTCLNVERCGSYGNPARKQWTTPKPPDSEGAKP